MKKLSTITVASIATMLVASWAVSAEPLVIEGPEPGDEVKHATFNADGSVNAPTGYRMWVYVGAPLTPNALNGGSAPFPEFHSVYVEPSAFMYYKKHGKWAEGSQLVKELNAVMTSESSMEDGSMIAPSGRGYFQGPAQGLELTVKDSKRFKDEPAGWAYFSFGHHSPPYAKTATALPTDTCNSCHEANAAHTDWVFTDYYPVLKALHGDKMGMK